MAATHTRPAVPHIGTVLTQAADLIARHGFRPCGFGDHTAGFSVEGAILQVLRLRASDRDLVEDLTDADPRWRAANAAFEAVAVVLPLRLRSDFASVCEWSERNVSAVHAVRLLGTAAVRYTAAHPQADR